jgi:hypothetical protein
MRYLNCTSRQVRSTEKLYHAGEREGDILLHLQSCTSNALRHSLSAQGRPATSPHAQRAQCTQRTHQAMSNTAHIHRPQGTHDAPATPKRASGVGRTQPHPTATKYDLQLGPTTTKNNSHQDRPKRPPGNPNRPREQLLPQQPSPPPTTITLMMHLPAVDASRPATVALMMNLPAAHGPGRTKPWNSISLMMNLAAVDATSHAAVALVMNLPAEDASRQTPPSGCPRGAPGPAPVSAPGQAPTCGRARQTSTRHANLH